MQNENKLGVMPIKKLIWNMSLPIIISMLVQALYNIVDSVFVSWVSEASLTAVSLAFPAQNIPDIPVRLYGGRVHRLLSLSWRSVFRRKASATGGPFQDIHY